jgi:hypothetical protein
MVRNQPGQIVRKTLSQKTLPKNRAGGVGQGEHPEFKTHVLQKKMELAPMLLGYFNNLCMLSFMYYLLV